MIKVLGNEKLQGLFWQSCFVGYFVHCFFCVAVKSEVGCLDWVEPSSYLGELKSLMGVDWPDNRTINIVFYGHSVPSGYFKTPVVDSINAYPNIVYQRLKKDYPKAVINVIVTAIGGETSDKGAARFEAYPMKVKLSGLGVKFNEREDVSPYMQNEVKAFSGDVVVLQGGEIVTLTNVKLN